MIRRINKNDRAVYLEMAEAMYNSEAVSHSVPAANFEKAFEHMINDGTYFEGFIMEYENRSAGFCAVAKSYSQEAGGIVLWVEDLYVLPEYRSKGLGNELFDFLEKEYGDKIVRMRLEITETNQGAKRLYERRGFEVCPYVPMIRELGE